MKVVITARPPRRNEPGVGAVRIRRTESPQVLRCAAPTHGFPELPNNLVVELKRRGCTIPQPYRQANVIRGEFAKPGQTDSAVLCSTKDYLRCWCSGTAPSVLLRTAWTTQRE